MLVAVSLFPIMAMLGGSVDIIRATNATNELEAAIASGALAAASLSQNGEARTVVEDYIRANLAGSSVDLSTLNLTVTEESSLNSRTVTATASVELPTLFLKIIDRDRINIVADTRAQQAIQDIEISLVLDYSISMDTRDQAGGQSRIETLKDAVTADGAFIDDVLTDDTINRTSINVIPFAGTVNLGQTLFDRYAVPVVNDGGICNSQWDPDDYDGNCWFYTFSVQTCSDFGGTWFGSICWYSYWEEEPTRGNLDPTADEYDLGYDVPESQWRFSVADTCVELPNSVYDDDSELPLATLGQYPHFWNAGLFVPVCPDQSAKIYLNSNDKQGLKDHINGARTADRTAVQAGALIGYKTLSPNMRGQLGGDFSDRPLDYVNPDALKVMIIMTDGQTNQQLRPLDPVENCSTHAYSGSDRCQSLSTSNGQNGGPYTSVYSLIYSSQIGDEDQTVLDTGSPTTSLTANNATAQLRRVCQNAKDDGIIIFTIGFEIAEGSDQEQNMQFCASDPSKYQLVSDIALVGAFEEIAASISNLRIVE